MYKKSSKWRTII